MTFEYLSSHFSRGTSEPILQTAKPNAEPTADPTIDPTVDPTVPPTYELWATPTGILSLGGNIIKKKKTFEYLSSH